MFESFEANSFGDHQIEESPFLTHCLLSSSAITIIIRRYARWAGRDFRFPLVGRISTNYSLHWNAERMKS